MGINESSYRWDGLVEDLSMNEFVKAIGTDEIWANQAYLYKIVNIEEYGTFFNIANLLLDSFERVPSVLMRCGENIFRYGISSSEKINFFELSVKAFNKALSFYSLNQFPIEFANINDDLGNIYIEFFKIKEDINICKKAESYLIDALKVRTKRDFPLDYGRINNNLGVIYSDLFRISEQIKREDYFQKSLKSLRLAQNIRKSLNFPIEYSNTQSNLGCLFHNYALFNGEEKNFRIAIRHYKNALKIRTIKKFPKQFGNINKSLGAAYSGIADVSKSKIEENLLNAISFFKKSLEVFSINFLTDYIEINNSIGEAYRKLVTQSASEKDFQSGLDYFNRSLTDISSNEYPEIYSRIKYNTGILFRIFGELKESEEYCFEAVKNQHEALDNLLTKDISSSIESWILFELGTSYYTYSYFSKINKIENIKKSIVYLNKSLEIFETGNSPSDYAITKNNLGYAYSLLAELEDLEQNCIKALNCYRIALRIININNFPIDYARIQDNIGLTFSLVGSSKNKIKKLYYAKSHYEKALEIRTANDLPLYHGVTQEHLGELYFELSKIENIDENLRKALDRYSIALKMFKKVKDKKHQKYMKNKINSIKKALRKV